MAWIWIYVFILAIRPEEEFFSKLDSSLKKNTTFVKKMVCLVSNSYNMFSHVFLVGLYSHLMFAWIGSHVLNPNNFLLICIDLIYLMFMIIISHSFFSYWGKRLLLYTILHETLQCVCCFMSNFRLTSARPLNIIWKGHVHKCSVARDICYLIMQLYFLSLQRNITEGQKESLSKEMQALNLSKYISEIVSTGYHNSYARMFLWIPPWVGV